MPQILRESSNVVKVAAAVVVVAGLSFGSPILVPIALSVLISFALAPLVARLERWHFGHVGSVLTVVFLGVALAAGTVLLLVGQAADLVTKLPAYRGNLSKKFEVVRSVERRWTSATGELARASQEPEEPRATARTDPSASAPRTDTHEYVPFWDSAGKSVQFLLTAGGVMVLVIFILLQRRDLHARALRVAGGGRYGVTSQALNEAAKKVSRYVLAEVALNTFYGIVITLGLLLIGIPNAFVWGLLCGLLRFVPYIGPVLAAAMPIGMSLAVSAGWGLPLATIGFFVVVELIVNNIIEPLVHGRSTGLSAVAILAAAAFWTWLWGPVGLILSTPLTVCFYVLGKHYPPLHFFHVLMGDVADKSLAARLYPRLVASDHDAVWEAVSEERLRSGLAEAFDVTLVPALELVKRNRRAGELEPEEAKRIVCEIDEIAEASAEEAMGVQTIPVGDVLCIPTGDEMDETCSRMLARVLEREGISARVCLPEAIAASVAEARKPSVFCVVDVRSSSPRRLQSLTRRLITRYPDIPVVAARLPGDGTADAPPASESPTLHSASTIEECREVVKRLVMSAAASAAAAVPAEAPVAAQPVQQAP